jgi:ParB-like chromosome segregation protein Spo0J
MRRWSPDEDELARELAADGYTRADVAAELGRTAYSVQCRSKAVGRFGFRRGGEPDAEYRALVLSLVAAGLSAAAVGRRLGRTRQAVSLLLFKLRADGLVLKTGEGKGARWRVTRKWDGLDGPPEELEEWVRRGDSYAEIGERIGRDRKTVFQWVRDAALAAP